MLSQKRGESSIIIRRVVVWLVYLMNSTKTMPICFKGVPGIQMLEYTTSEKVWALPNLFTRVYTRL
jgi:hypothetical protein